MTYGNVTEDLSTGLVSACKCIINIMLSANIFDPNRLPDLNIAKEQVKGTAQARFVG